MASGQQTNSEPVNQGGNAQLVKDKNTGRTVFGMANEPDPREAARAANQRKNLTEKINKENSGGFAAPRNVIKSVQDQNKELAERINKENSGGFGRRYTF